MPTETAAVLFEKSVEAALIAWRASGQDVATFDSLANLLGCTAMGGSGKLKPSLPANEAIMHAAWITMFHERDPESGQVCKVERFILSGLLHNDRWRTFLSSERDLRSFILLCARFLWMGDKISTAATPANRDAYSPIRTQLKLALAPWLPRSDNPSPLSERDLAIAFFGEAWCVLVYDLRPDWISLAAVLPIDLPAFAPGRLDIAEVQSPDLPSL